jgi:hypothetical protein
LYSYKADCVHVELSPKIYNYLHAIIVEDWKNEPKNKINKNITEKRYSTVITAINPALKCTGDPS